MKRAGLALLLVVFGLCAGSPAAWALYESKGKRNPFIPLLLTDGQRITPPPDEEELDPMGLGSLVLQGVVYDPSGDSTVILNGQLLRENEEWEGIRVLKIESNTVTIWKDGETHELTVREPEEEEKQTE